MPFSTPDELKTAVLKGLHDYELAMAGAPVDEVQILAFGSPVGVVPPVYFVILLGTITVFSRTRNPPL